MFSKKTPEAPKRRNFDLTQFGLSDLPDDFDPSTGFEVANDGNDSDLEAELAAITAGVNRSKAEQKHKPVPANELDRMIAESLKDVENVDDEDESVETDSELLSELQDIVGVGEDKNEECVEESNSIETPETFPKPTDSSLIEILKQRIEVYKIAETNAKAAGELAKMRRFNRGLKTLNDLLRQSISGKSVSPDDIPPAISVMSPVGENSSAMDANDSGIVPSRPAPMPPSTVVNETIAKEDDQIAEPLQNNPTIQQMRSLQQEYKVAALKSKRNGDTAMALQYLKVVKQFDVVVKMCEDGQNVDLSDMPPPPEHFKQFMENLLAVSEQHNTNEQMTPESSLAMGTESVVQPVNTNETNILEALQQRLSKYKSVEESAKTEGNASKARRFGRIVKQYESAIKDYKDGRSVAYEELPVPPGFGPLPAQSSTGQKPPSVAEETAVVAASSPAPPTKKLSSPPQNDLANRTAAVDQPKHNLAEKQMNILLDRQKEFKMSAIEAKKAGDIDQAKEYLKMYKGFDALLNAARSGLPVDLSSLPVPPSQRHNLEDSFAIVTTEECDPNDDISDIGVRVEEQLAKQLMMCKNTRDHHKAMGDIAGMNRFENLALTVQKDLDVVRYSKRKNYPLPKFHYEQRCFNIVHCNTDLTENEFEITVVRGINYNVSNPKEVDTYVRIDFPLPNDASFKAKTNLVKDTDSPEYNQNFKIEILRGNRQLQRIFKRHAVKFEVYSRGGFLRSDTLIGTVNVKLQPLEVKCDIHDTFDLVEGRKKIGGKLEIKMRVRNPMLTKQIEQINEKWLIIDT